MRFFLKFEGWYVRFVAPRFLGLIHRGTFRARPRVRPISLFSPDISSSEPPPSLVNVFPVSSVTQGLMPLGGGMSTTERGADRSPSMPAAKRSTREDRLPLSIKSISLAVKGAFALAPLGGSARRDAIPPSAGDASRAVKWTLGTTAGPARDGAKAAFGNDAYKRTDGKRIGKRRVKNNIWNKSVRGRTRPRTFESRERIACR